MKLVIDIPEQMYLNAKKDMLCGSDILVSAIKNGTPYETVTEFADRCRECGRERVLDELRAEIEQEPYVSKMEVLDIIDEYRTESKKV
jgi:hypothetical protein